MPVRSKRKFIRTCAMAVAALCLLALAPQQPKAQGPVSGHMVFHVRLDAPVQGPASGRLILLAQRWDDLSEIGRVIGPKPDPTRPSDVFVAVKDIDRLESGQTIEIDADAKAYPGGFSRLAPGSYAVQAILDVDRNFAYSNFAFSGDIRSETVRMELPAGRTVLSLGRVSQPRQPWTTRNENSQAARADTLPIRFLSPSLTAFHGASTYIEGWLIKPPGYDGSSERFPTVYRTDGFGSSLSSLTSALNLVPIHRAMATGEAPPMIWVFLDHSGPTGTHEFADSANNGPWGKALTEELIPWLETQYRMDARPSGRFLTGHSSGGWMALWTQVRYPKLFGGAWPTAPDPVDFHEFTNIDIYAPGANAYRRPDGSPTPLIRQAGQAAATFQTYAQLEDVLGERGGQIRSFDWVFSPKGPDGRPRPLFDHSTGAIDPQVAAYWRDNYDITYRIRTNWPALRPDLDGKIHLIVGTEDTFYLDRAARRLQAVLNELGAKADFRFIEGRDHSDLGIQGRDANGLSKTIAWEMYAIARPGFRRSEASIQAQERNRLCGSLRIPTPPTEFFDSARYDPASRASDLREIRDGRDVVVALFRGQGPLDASAGVFITPATGSAFYGSDGALIGTLVIDPFCGGPKIVSPTTPYPLGSRVVRDRQGKIFVRPSSYGETGDTTLARF